MIDPVLRQYFQITAFIYRFISASIIRFLINRAVAFDSISFRCLADVDLLSFLINPARKRNSLDADILSFLKNLDWLVRILGYNY